MCSLGCDRPLLCRWPYDQSGYIYRNHQTLSLMLLTFSGGIMRPKRKKRMSILQSICSNCQEKNLKNKATWILLSSLPKPPPIPLLLQTSGEKKEMIEHEAKCVVGWEDWTRRGHATWQIDQRGSKLNCCICPNVVMGRNR